MSDTMELPVPNLGTISEVNSMSVLETNPPKPTGFILSKREVESVFCHSIKWDLASPMDPPKCLLDGDDIDEKIVSSPSHFSSVEDICLALDESQETPEIKGKHMMCKYYLIAYFPFDIYLFYLPQIKLQNY